MSDIDGNAGPSRTCISWHERGSVNAQMLSSKCGMETLREADHYGWISSVRYLGAKS